MNAARVSSSLRCPLLADSMPQPVKGFRFGFGSVTSVHLAPHDWLRWHDPGLLVCVTQDVWHVKRRIEHALPKDHPDRSRFLYDVSQILSLCSIKHNAPITAATPQELQKQLLSFAKNLQEQLLGLISKWQQAVTAQTSKAQFYTSLSHLARRLAASDQPSITADGIDEVDAAADARGIFAPTTLPAATCGQAVDAEQV